MVEIGIHINPIKKVGLPQGHFREVAASWCVQDMRRGQRSQCAISSMDFQHIVEHDAALMLRYACHNPNEY